MSQDPWAGSPGSANSTAMAPPQESPLSDWLKKAGKAVKGFEKSPVVKTLQEFAQLPSEAQNAVLGAPQRIIAERLANLGSNPAGVLAATLTTLGVPIPSKAAAQELGHEAYAVFHPNDPEMQNRAMAATGVNRLLTNDPRFRGKLQNFAVTTGFQTLTDPLTYTGAATGVAGEEALARMGQAGTRALSSENDAVRNLARSMLTNVEERQGGFAQREVAAINALRQRSITRWRVSQTADDALLHRNKAALLRGEIPDEVRQRLLREPYIYGSQDMRQQALALGYKPTKAEAAKPPADLLNYNLRHNYDPHTGEMRTPQQFDDLLLGEEARYKEPAAGFENQQTIKGAPKQTLYDRIERRLSAGRSAIRFRETSQAMQQHLGLSPEMAKSLAISKKFGNIPALRAVSRAKVDALLATGVPHIRNVGVMGFNALGEGGMARAIQYFLFGPPKTLVERLEEGGGSTHFGVRTPAKYSPTRLLPTGIRRTTTGMLDRWDQAVRAARLEQLDANRGMTELEKMDRVNQDIGSYNLKPHYVRLAEGIGANFPQWHGYVVPTAVGRAILRNPGRVERLARYEQNANDSFLGDKQYRWTIGGPNDEFASAIADLARVATGKQSGYSASRYPSYFGGESMIGPAAELLHPTPGTLGERAVGAAASFIPFGNVALEALANPFKSPVPAVQRAIVSVLGPYTQKRTAGSMRRTKKTQAATTGGDPWAGAP